VSLVGVNFVRLVQKKRTIENTNAKGLNLRGVMKIALTVLTLIVVSLQD
jgi:hypothetical protein